MSERAFECDHVRIMFCEHLASENNKSKMDEICNRCAYHRPKGKSLFCFARKPVKYRLTADYLETWSEGGQVGIEEAL